MSRPGFLDTAVMLGALSAAENATRDDTDRMAALFRRAVELLTPANHFARMVETQHQLTAMRWGTTEQRVHRFLVVQVLARLDVIHAERDERVAAHG